MDSVFGRKVGVALSLIEARFGRSFSRVLVVGCGGAAEVFAIAEEFDCVVTGIDISADLFPARVDPRVTLMVVDAAKMPFPDAHFDLIYSFHALEHIEGLDDALAEMRRVLKPGGSVFVGTPNKSRVVGYLGSDTTFAKKVEWNLADWKMRLTGRWDNAKGAHAGFTRSELLAIVERTFGKSRDQTDAYYLQLYARRRKLVEWLIGTDLSALAFPAVYASN